MNTEYISKRLLEVIFLLAGSAVLHPLFRYIIVATLPMDEPELLFHIQHWSVQLIFASVLLGLGHVPKRASIYVFLLSIVLPLYGGILYIIVTSLKKKKYEQGSI